jgi:hypothetical protein
MVMVIFKKIAVRKFNKLNIRIFHYYRSPLSRPEKRFRFSDDTNLHHDQSFALFFRIINAMCH